MSKHTAPQTASSIIHEITQGIREDFNYPDRNGQHRAIESFNPLTGAATRIYDTRAAA